MSGAGEAVAALGGVVGDLADAMRAGRLPSWRADLVRAGRVGALAERYRFSVRRARRLQERAETARVQAAGYRGAATASSGVEAATYRRRERRLLRIADRLDRRAGVELDRAEGCRVQLEDLGEVETVARLDAWRDG